MIPAILHSPLLIWVENCFPGPWRLLFFFSPFLTLFSGTVLMSWEQGRGRGSSKDQRPLGSECRPGDPDPAPPDPPFPDLWHPFLWLGLNHYEPEVTALTSPGNLKCKGLTRRSVGAWQYPFIEFCLCLSSSSPHRVLSLHPWWADRLGSRHRDASHPRSTVSQRTLLPGNALVIRFLPCLVRKALDRGLQRKEAVLVICSEEVARSIVPNVTPHLEHIDRFFNGSVVILISVGLWGGQEKKAAWGIHLGAGCLRTMLAQARVCLSLWGTSFSRFHVDAGKATSGFTCSLAKGRAPACLTWLLTSLPCKTGPLAVAIARVEKPSYFTDS